MKTIYMVRHAKSSWGDFTTPDFDRPLNERGKRDAPEMGKRLLDKKIRIDAFVSSPAKRAKSTCKAFCKVYNRDKDEIIFIDELYHASVETFNKVVSGLDNKLNAVAIFSHNPGITDFVNLLVQDVHIDNMPTCAVFAVQVNTNNWKDFLATEKKCLFVDYPKLGAE
ncbi:MAG: histidine phosphatase family protein [Sphingobacteriales bacterium]|nr:MAG: histidine phosphatase family protein [Sphingobacteriales bacterium]